MAVDKEDAAIKRIQYLQHPNATILHAGFENIQAMLKADFVCAYLSLPFCPPDHFDRVMNLVSSSVHKKGFFAGSFLGMEDDWVKSGKNQGLTEEKLRAYFANYDILHLQEEKKYAPTVLSDAKNWHIIELIAHNT